MKSLLLLIANLLLIQAYIQKRSIINEYKMCVPEDLLEYCQAMSLESTKSTTRIICTPARDRFECIEKVKQKVADFVVVDPEDMYIASKETDGNFAIFEEIRTREEPDAEFRYEAVAVIHKDLDITDLNDLKGLNSCHTGVGRNVGYKIPLTKLKQKGIIGQMNDFELSARENELKALSTLFNKACIVGAWSPDVKLDLKWKGEYPSLCALCEHPDKCDYPDNFSGYEGALRCLAHNGGQIAWTKVIYVRKYFGLPVGTTPASPSSKNPEKFAYLCPDGTKIPVTDTPCRWAARPWQGFMANADVIKNPTDLREKLEELNRIGTKKQAPWLLKILEQNDKSIPKPNKLITPGDYLDKANYTDVIEQDYGPPFKRIRFCVTEEFNHFQLDKCEALSKSAFSRNIRPRIECIKRDHCLSAIEYNVADITTLEPCRVARARQGYNLVPIMAEKYKDGDGIYSVVVVKKTSNFNSFDDLKRAKSCHTHYWFNSHYVALAHTLFKKGLVKQPQCPYYKALAQFVGDSCFPGINTLLEDYSQEIEKLCKLCIGDGVNPDSKCNSNSSEIYSGPSGALRCLVEGGGEVAFVDHSTVPSNTNGNNQESWSKNLKSTDFELLCPDGGRRNITEYKLCNLVQAPPDMVVTAYSKENFQIDEIRNLLISLSSMYTERSDLFKLFGLYKNENNLLFRDSVVALEVVSFDNEKLKEWSEIYNPVRNYCVSL